MGGDRDGYARLVDWYLIHGEKMRSGTKAGRDGREDGEV